MFKEQSEIRDVQRLMDCFKGTVECSISKIARKANREKLLENRVGLGIQEDGHFDILPRQTVRFSEGGRCSFQKVAYKPFLSAVFGSLSFADREVFSLVCIDQEPIKE